MIHDFLHILNRRALAWSILSLLAGGFWSTEKMDLWRGIGMAVGICGLAGAVIAWPSMVRSSWKLPLAFSLDELAIETRKAQKYLMAFCALAGVVLAGGIVIHLLVGTQTAFWRGFAWGIIIQGSFFLLLTLIHWIRLPTEPTLPDLGLFDAPEHAAFHLSGRRGTVVLVHGFPGTPNEMRPLAEALNRNGWGVRAILLPGFGRQISTLFQQRSATWVDAITQEVEAARSDAKPVVLCGFSMGGGLSVTAATRCRPDGLVLIAPFWFDESLVVRGLVWVTRIFLPVAIRPFRRIRFPNLQLRAAAGQVAPEIDLDHPAMQQMARELRIPFLLAEQFRQFSFSLQRNAAQLRLPTLVIQGNRDPIVRPALSRKIARRIGDHARYHEVDGEHHIILSDSSGFEATVELIKEFLDQKVDLANTPTRENE